MVLRTWFIGFDPCLLVGSRQVGHCAMLFLTTDSKQCLQNKCSQSLVMTGSSTTSKHIGQKNDSKNSPTNLATSMPMFNCWLSIIKQKRIALANKHFYLQFLVATFMLSSFSPELGTIIRVSTHYIELLKSRAQSCDWTYLNQSFSNELATLIPKTSQFCWLRQLTFEHFYFLLALSKSYNYY